jgi:hypothetical protein
MANFLNGFLDSVLDGFSAPKGNLGDFQHAARLYNSRSMRLAPKAKFMYHVVFNINPAAFSSADGTALNMLVKQVELPKFRISVDRPIQYNRKKAVNTKLEYQDIGITFHDDNIGITTAMWAGYYGYYFGDSKHSSSQGSATSGNALSGMGKILGGVVPGVSTLLGAAGGGTSASVPAAYKRNTYKGEEVNKFRYGLDNGSSVPFFTSIQIFQLSRHEYQSFTLINPLITNWQHETMNSGASGEVAQNSMQVAYEAVIYGKGSVSSDNPTGFATQYYDKGPSSLRSTSSIFGAGGILSNVGSILDDVGSGNIGFGTLAKTVNLARQTKSLSKEGVRAEGFSILKDAIGATAGTDVSGVANIAFPKEGGKGQNQTTTATAPKETTKQNTPAQRKQAFDNDPAAKQALVDLAIKSGVVAPGANAEAAVDGFIDSGRNIKLNSLADKVIGQAS